MAFHLVVTNRIKGASARPEDRGVFAERKDAIAAAQRIIDDWMAKNHQPGMDGPALYSRFLEYGDIPAIFGDEGYSIGRAFDYTQYAKDRAKQLCEPPS